ncbi:TKL protein kinase [Saprolegnia parasitica CBS 223.65]|uniref:TKL protein kinase n=1 Tax=Saprolegnia parasitica (strain CBS 223.65) TaxID=695850 RepID=A0A067BKT0_SAPPC|nr:TKL protein kinase [Saprolegnia parasitica CBS 223.65]KDO18788.1 TKL protein kinase [Saprolegnia parasitica CBS 223.65]|eukprot:XP_012210510.1 TKL protein kinase [Saprolegnia parasitica CBS 223.65]
MAEPIKAAFFHCSKSDKNGCASDDVRQFLTHCGQFEDIGFDQAAGSACCFETSTSAVRQCLYYNTAFQATRINLFYDPARSSAKPTTRLANHWSSFQHITWLDIAGVSIADAITPTTFSYGAMQKLVIDADLSAIETPPIASLHVLDLHGNALSSFPTFLFRTNYASIQHLDVGGNKFPATLALSGDECSSLQKTIDAGHVTGHKLACNCAGANATCALAPATTTPPPTTVAPTTATSPTTAPVQPPPSPTNSTSSTHPTEIGTAPPPQSDPANAKTSGESHSDSGTVIISSMLVIVVLLAAAALFLYRRRKRLRSHLPGGPTTVSGTLFSPQSGHAFTRPLLLTGAPRSLKHVDSLSSHLSSERDLKVMASMRSSRMPITHHVDKVPILQPGECRILKAMGPAVFAGQYKGENVVVRRVDARIISEDDVATFVSDVNQLAQLVHPQLVALHGIVRLGDYEVGAVAEFMHCGSLPHILMNQDVDIAWPDTLRMCFQVASGLAYVHSQAEFARTECLTSRSVLVNTQLTCKLNIFEYMRHFQQHETVHRVYGDGTIAWEAPEVLMHDCPRGGTADVYSLGVVMGEIVTRTRPFQRYVDALGFVRADVAILDRDAKSTEYPFSDDVEFESCPKPFRLLMLSCLQRDVLKRPLAVSVAEELRRELLLLSKNFG